MYIFPSLYARRIGAIVKCCTSLHLISLLMYYTSSLHFSIHLTGLLLDYLMYRCDSQWLRKGVDYIVQRWHKSFQGRLPCLMLKFLCWLGSCQNLE